MKKKLQETYDLAVREVLADLSVMEEDDYCYTLSVDKKIYDNFLGAIHALSDARAKAFRRRKAAKKHSPSTKGNQ
jgi:hypothetical protein